MGTKGRSMAVRAAGRGCYVATCALLTLASWHLPLVQTLPVPGLTVFAAVNNECDQLTIDTGPAVESWIAGFLEEGTCANAGYAVAAGSELLHVPVLGKITVSKFRKEVSQSADDVRPSSNSTLRSPLGNYTLYSIQGEPTSECAQAAMGSISAIIAREFAGLQDGTCASQGYTVADGTEVLSVPVVGHITMNKYKKANSTVY